MSECYVGNWERLRAEGEIIKKKEREKERKKEGRRLHTVQIDDKIERERGAGVQTG